MRTAFINELISAAEKNDRVCLVVGDLGYGVIEPFAERFPKRFFNAGVAEQNMMGLAAGLASEGFHVFVYSIANFPTFRCAEQIRNDIDYHNLPVTIVSVGGGLAYGKLGYSHHAIQDYALLRTMPNMTIASPGDPYETIACVKYLIKNPCPSYLRLGKAGEPKIHTKIPKITPGKWLTINHNEKNIPTFLTTGSSLNYIYSHLRQINKKYCLKTLPIWGMKYKNLQKSQIRETCKVITFEDHLIDGGFGSWMLESAHNEEELIKKIKINGLHEKICGLVGDQEILNKKGGLNLSAIKSYL